MSGAWRHPPRKDRKAQQGHGPPVGTGRFPVIRAAGNSLMNTFAGQPYVSAAQRGVVDAGLVADALSSAVFGEEFGSEPIPTFAEVLKYCAALAEEYKEEG